MSLLQSVAGNIADTLGRDSWIVRHLRSPYESLLLLSRSPRGAREQGHPSLRSYMDINIMSPEASMMAKVGAVAEPQQMSRTPATGGGGHVPALDGVRGIAILLVLFFHFPTPFSWLRPLTAGGWCGVDLFFVLSGYLITGILYSTTTKAHYFRNFYVRRSLRIFPLYYGYMILVLLILPRFVNPYWFGLENLHGRATEFFLYYSNYATVFSGWTPPSLGVFWSLAVEEHFYLFWPLFMKVTPKSKLLGGCALVAVLALLSRLAITYFKVTWLAAYYLTTSRVDSLVVGSMTAILVRQRPELLKRWMPVIGGTSLALLSALAIWRHGLTFNDWPMRTFGYSFLALLFACLVWRAGTATGRFATLLSNPILVAFGKYSYALYVFHLLVQTLCERLLGPRLFAILGWRSSAPLPLFVLSMIVTLVLASLSWRLYERPFLSLKDRLTV